MNGKNQNGQDTLDTRVLAQEWVESERGWGIRPDGRSLHMTEEDCKSFIKEYWAKMPNYVPDEYSRPEGKPYLTQVDTATYQRVSESKCGVWEP